MDDSEVVERLQRRFGVGTRRELRMALYERLGRLVRDEGQGALNIIAAVAADAAGKRDPGRYFAFVVMKRLMERGLIPAPEL